MNAPVPSRKELPVPGQARDLQAQLYRDIGISAVAAALRFTTLPDPVPQHTEFDLVRPAPRRNTLAA